MIDDGVKRTKTDLKPCPFCGGDNLVEGFHSPFVICDDCGAFGPGNADITHEEAIERWNTRAETVTVTGITTVTNTPQITYVPERTCKLTLDGTDGCFGCSECFENIPPLANYCPNCGAKVVQSKPHSKDGEVSSDAGGFFSEAVGA